MTFKYRADSVRSIHQAVKRVLLSACLGVTLLELSTLARAEEASGDAEAGDSAAVATSEAVETENGKSSLDTLYVNGHVQSNAQDLKVELEKVPGAVSVVDNAEIDRGRNSNLEDVLAFQPGIFAQSTSGTEANKVTIRGSGLNAFYGGYSLGLTYLINGVPITGAAGTQEDLLSMHAVNATEVLYGANAFDYSSTSLGGAINFITENGYTSRGAYVRAEFGSYGYQKEQVSYGAVIGDTDFYFSAQHNYRSGYQDNTALHGNDVFINVGHTFSDRLKTRFFARFRREQYNNGSPLTLSQVEHSPTTNNYQWARWKPNTVLAGSVTSYTFDDESRLELAVGVDNFPLIHGIPNSFWQWYQSTDLSTSLRYLRKDHLFGHESNTTLTVSNVELVNSYMQQKLPVASNLNLYDQNVNNTGSRTSVISIGNDTEVVNAAWLTSGISVSDVVRDIRIIYNAYPNTTTFPNTVDYHSWSLAPRLGFRYEFAPDIVLFTNVSRSIDPPVTWQYIGGSASDAYLVPLRSQTAVSGEIGVRASAGIFEGSLTLYRSWIDGELLTTVLIPASATNQSVTKTINSSPTIHQGIEAGLVTNLWQSDAGHRLSFRQAYTFNDFYYSHDSVFNKNQLPGIPRWVYQGALQYDHASGFYAQANVRSASSYYVDFANTWQAPFYATVGTKLGYEASERRWSVFLEGKNLTNRHYVSATNTSYDLGGATGGVSAPNFYPGDGRSVYGGFSFRY